MNSIEAMDYAALLAHERAVAAKSAAKFAAAKSAAKADAALPTPSLVPLHGGVRAVERVSYCDDFLSDAEAARLVAFIEHRHERSEWLELRHRKLLMLGGTPHPAGLMAEDLPDWLHRCVLARLHAMGVLEREAKGVTVLLNEYVNAQDSIAPHNDGPLFEPRVAIISLGTAAALRFYDPAPRGVAGAVPTEVGAVVLQPGSLLVFEGDAYVRLLHGIEAAPRGDVESLDAASILSDAVNRADAASVASVRPVRRGRRLSLTVRIVKHVAKAAAEYVSPDDAAEMRRRREWWAGAVSEKGTEKWGGGAGAARLSK